MIIYIYRRQSHGRASNATTNACPIARDCYLCKYRGCRTYPDGGVRIQGVNPADLPGIQKKANVTHVLKESADNGGI